uniref:Uncharacterized protein n=2 Tax=Picea TaxID=3328 RepID=A0A124GMX8_PICGL|nr:hypothetical protein ABT39_MTgene6084 [Picea glauca]QHR89957.1 hypothetical protein Q903MT_gene3979 [Picea sitchensis]
MHLLCAAAVEGRVGRGQRRTGRQSTRSIWREETREIAREWVVGRWSSAADDGSIYYGRVSNCRGGLISRVSNCMQRRPGAESEWTLFLISLVTLLYVITRLLEEAKAARLV